MRLRPLTPIRGSRWGLRPRVPRPPFRLALRALAICALAMVRPLPPLANPNPGSATVRLRLRCGFVNRHLKTVKRKQCKFYFITVLWAGGLNLQLNRAMA